MTIPIAASLFGAVVLFLGGFAACLSIFVCAPAFWLFSTGLAMMAAGIMFFGLGVTIKVCSLLFRK